MDKEAVAATFAEAEVFWSAAPLSGAGPADDAADDGDKGHVGLSLADADAAELEMGIASVFDSLRAEAETDEGDEGPAIDDGLEPTYALLNELNRLWVRPQALSGLS